jgi:hypothetical protein
LGKAEKRQVAKEVEEQDGALPEDWRGEEIGTIGKVSLLSPTMTFLNFYP